jgi:hypothetical protein
LTATVINFADHPKVQARHRHILSELSGDRSPKLCVVPVQAPTIDFAAELMRGVAAVAYGKANHCP